ncbi:MAG: WecB/TagA/CpsF family glycosyltransferase [Candidatus Acidiferrales bacterium]
MPNQDTRGREIETLSIAHILGVPVHVIERDQAICLMEHWIAQPDESHWIALTSSHGIVEGYKYPEFKVVLESASLSLPDGKWTGRFAGWRRGCAPKQVRGADLLWKFCEVSSKEGYRNFFYGDTEEVLTSLICELRKRFPALNVAGTYSPPFRELTSEEDSKITNLINQANPDVLWVGLGLPKQERWIYEHQDRLHAPVVVAVGAAFKFVSGKVKCAPSWVSDCGLEWAWRFLHEPRRLWHRVVIYGPQFFTHAVLELSGLRKYE